MRRAGGSHLAVNKGRQMPGKSYPGNWLREKEEVAAFDWSAVQPAWTLTSRRRSRRPHYSRNARRRRRDVLFTHFRANCSSYKDFKLDDREEMVNLPMAGIDVETALCSVSEAKAALDEVPSMTRNTKAFMLAFHVKHGQKGSRLKEKDGMEEAT